MSEIGRHRLLHAGGAPTDGRGGGRAVRPGLEQLARDLPEIPHAHQHHQRVRGLSEATPVDRTLVLLGGFVPGGDYQGGGEAAVGNRDSGVGGHRERGTNAWHHYEGYPALREIAGLFSAAAEQERVAAFQTTDRRAGRRFLCQKPIDLILTEGMAASNLPDVDEVGVGSRFRQQFRACQPIVDYDISPPEYLQAASGDQPRVSRACAHKIDCALHHHCLPTSKPAAPAASSVSAS